MTWKTSSGALPLIAALFSILMPAAGAAQASSSGAAQASSSGAAQASSSGAAQASSSGAAQHAQRAQQGSPGYHQVATIPLGGEGFWDYLSVDTAGHRLYVSHATKVVVVDLRTNKVVGEVDSLPGVHGLVAAPSLGMGFASAGRQNTAAFVDLKTLQMTKRVKTGKGPDTILYVPGFEQVYTFNGRSNDATAIDAKTGDVVATIPLPGRPEFAVYDPTSKRIYNNIEDKSLIAVIDPATHKVVATWPISPGEEASGLAIDVAHHRLFAVCRNGVMVMVNTETGAVVD
ncbi:MAG: hypothetical protein P8174_00640, partial [Gemmatimonadota bacterium]